MSANELLYRYTKHFYDCCKHIALDAEDPMAIRKLVALNMRVVDVQRHYLDVFSDVGEENLFVDWEKMTSTHRFLQDSNLWISILENYISIKPAETSLEVKSNRRQFRAINEITESLARNRITISWKDTVFLFLLLNIARVPSLHVSKTFLSKVLGREVDKECTALIGDIADARYTPAEFMACVRWVFFECIGEQTSELEANIQKINKHSMGVREIFAVRNMRINTGRLRLRDRLNGKRRQQALVECNTFQAFESNVNFSSNVSYHTKLKLYLLMSQWCVDKNASFEGVFPEYLRYVLEVPSTPPLPIRPHVAPTDCLCCPQHPSIENPDVKTINEAISKIKYTQAPFTQLSQFYEQCFRSIAFARKNAISLSTIMQLYVAIYQNQKIWQDCWTYIFPVKNAQVVRDIETFRQKNPVIDHAQFQYALSTIK